jgi:trans-aconitate 2-methyltransferase
MTTMPAREWDASAYERVAAPMTERGVGLLGRLALEGDELVLDAGCGTGQVTAELLRRLPEGRVIALDGSAAMLDVARERFGADPRVRYLRADLERPPALDEPVDAIVSTSTFHWIADHDALFAGLRDMARPGAALAADFGGEGNIQRVLDALAGLGFHEHPWTFASVADTEARLRAAGFGDIDVRLVPRPAAVPADELVTYLRTVVLGSHVEALGAERGQRLAEDVAAALDEPVLDYVRLEVVARRL